MSWPIDCIYKIEIMNEVAAVLTAATSKYDNTRG